jgi:hydrogenase nickel incorporation protein HypA/HybF
MHEMQLAVELAGIVAGVAEKEKLNTVSRVSLQFGEMIQVVPDIFRFAFSEAVRGTIAEHAEIEIEIIPVTLRCTNCLTEFVMEELNFRCRSCGSTDIEIINGKEMFIKSLEGA